MTPLRSIIQNGAHDDAVCALAMANSKAGTDKATSRLPTTELLFAAVLLKRYEKK